MATDRWRSEDEWPEDKAGPEYSMHKDREEREPKRPKTRFPVIYVSALANDLVTDLEDAMYRLEGAGTKEEVAEAYIALNQRRKELFQYLSTLEFNAQIKREVTRRFD
jgi:hypothetical protein